MNKYAYQVDLSGVCTTPCPHFKYLKVGSTGCFRCMYFECDMLYRNIPKVGAVGIVSCNFKLLG